MPWWGWMIVGGLLLGAELFFIEADFYLVFLGVSALLVGAGVLAGMPVPAWGEWLVFALLAVVSMVLFRRQLYLRFRPPAAGFEQGGVGDLVTLDTPLAPGARGRVVYRGSSWTVINAGTEPIPAGGEARITAISGLTLEVAAPSHSS